MELALREYSLKNALADENDAASSKKSGSSSAGSKSGSKSGSGTAERGTLTSQTLSGGITTRAKKYRGANGGGTGGGVR